VTDNKPLVGVIMGSQSDWETMRHAADTLRRLGIAHESRIVSAHRTPRRMLDYAEAARGRGLKVIIAAAVLALNDAAIARALDEFRAKQTASVAEAPVDQPA
jgi:5-(carboxyamino)imidazole ribonucleotide mutase